MPKPNVAAAYYMENEKYTPIHSFIGVIGDNNRPGTQKSLDCVEVESRYVKDIVNAEKEQREDVFKKITTWSHTSTDS